MTVELRNPLPCCPALADGRLLRRFLVHAEAQGVRYCLLRGGERTSPSPCGYEIDLLVDPDDLWQFVRLATRAGFAQMPSRGHAPHLFFVAYDRVEHVWIKLDVVTSLLYGRPLRLLSFGGALDPLQRRAHRWGVPALAQVDEMVHLVLHGLLDKATIEPPHRLRLRALFEQVRVRTADIRTLEREFTGTFGSVLPWSVVQHACETDDWSDVVARRSAVTALGVRRDPVGVGRRFLTGAVARLLARPRGPRLERGCLIAVLGPDGAGKTTLAQGIAGSAPFVVRRIYMGHGSGEAKRASGIAGRLARLAAEVRSDSPQTRSLFYRVRRLLARFALQAMRSIEIRIRRRCGQVVVLDRHVLDFQVARGPKSWPRRAVGWVMQGLCPKPDLVVVLDAPADELHRRKPDEHSRAELAAQRSAYATLGRHLTDGIVVNAARHQSAVQDDVITHIWSRYTANGREAVQ